MFLRIRYILCQNTFHSHASHSFKYICHIWNKINISIFLRKPAASHFFRIPCEKNSPINSRLIFLSFQNIFSLEESQGNHKEWQLLGFLKQQRRKIHCMNFVFQSIWKLYWLFWSVIFPLCSLALLPIIL